MVRNGDAAHGSGRSSRVGGAAFDRPPARISIAADERRRYIRLDAGKVNLAASSKTRWFELIGVSIGNSTELYPHGDGIQVAANWKPPETWADLSNATLNTVLDDIASGLSDGRRYSSAAPAKATAAWQVVKKHCPHKSEKQCREIIKTWVDNEVLYSEPYKNPVTREDAQGLRVNDAKRPSWRLPE